MDFRHVIMLLLVCVLATSIVDARQESVNESFLLTDITTCDGPVTVRVNPDVPLKDGELFIEKCRQDSYNIWKCNCDKTQDGFDINVKIFNLSNNVYDFWVHYYIYYDESWVNDSSRVPTFDENRLGKFERFKRFNNIYVTEPDIEPERFKFSSGFQKIILSVILIVIIVITIFVYKSGGIRKNASKQSEKNDMLNYVTKDEDFEEMIRRLK